jgi:uncharacterized phage-like protein YoqJ
MARKTAGGFFAAAGGFLAGAALLGTMAGFSPQCSDAEAAKAAINTSWSGTHTEPVKDPALGETAFTVAVPDGWKFVGTILRPGGCHSAAIPADGLSYTMLSSDGVTAMGQMPGSSWMWASDGSSPLGKGCAPLPISTANAFLLNIAVPTAHPGARLLKVVQLTDKEITGLKAAREQANSGPSYGIKTTHIIDAGRVQIEYTVNGQTYDEQFGTVLTCMETQTPAYPLLHRAAGSKRMCQAHGTRFRRTAQGHLDALLAGNLAQPDVNHQWDQEIAQRMQQQFAAFQKASDAQFQAIEKHYADANAAMLQRGRDFQNQLKTQTDHAMAADRANQAAIDHSAQATVRYSLDRQDFIDPNTGRKIETSNQYMHNWVGSDGTVVLNDDPTFNPNGEINPVRESFTELIPVN